MTRHAPGSSALAAVSTAFLAAVPVWASTLAGNRAAEREVSTRSLLSLKDIGGEAGVISVSPDGGLVAFQIQQADFIADTYRSNWYVVRASGGAAPVRVGSGGDLILSPAPFGRLDGARADIQAKWSPDGQWIAYLRKDGDQVQVWRSRADGTREEQVSHTDANVLDFVWRPDGRAIYVQVGRSRREMAREDGEEGRRGYLLDDRFVPGYSTRPLWVPCGENLWRAPLVSSQRCTPRTWVVKFGSPEREASAEEGQAYRTLTTPERPPEVGAGRIVRGIAWNRDHTRAAWLENLSPRDKPGFGAPLTLLVDNRPCSAPQCVGQLEAVWWHGTDVVFLRREGWAHSVRALYVWRPGTGSPRRIYRADSELSSCAIAGDRLLCLQETPTTPRKIVSIRLEGGRVDTVFDPNPDFAGYALGRVEKLEVSDGFGNQGFGHLVYPPDFNASCRYPLVIVQYRSRGFLRGGIGNEYPIYPLAAAGFLVFSSDGPADERLTSRYDTSSWQGIAALSAEETGPSGYRMRSWLGALEAVIERLESRGIVDRSRIGITGLSAGAEVVDFALTHSTRFAAAAISGMESPDSYALEVNTTMRALSEAQWSAHSLAEAIRIGGRVESLAHDVSRVNTPLLMQVADHELIMTLPDYVALKEAGKPVEAYVFPDELHVKFHPLHKLAVGERAIDWFRFWLKGEEDPAPEKAEQYARWRQMRGRMSRGPSSGDHGLGASHAAPPSSGPDLGGNACGERR
ncbi:MAG: Atxe2 family lasso peptide isopeptidase [Steroidobacteraceae bacterium]